MTGPDDPAWRWEFHCEDFVYARLTEQQTTAEAMPPGRDRDQALNHVDSLYLIASQHNIWVDFRGSSAGRCITCKPSDGGVPCLTMTGLARLWREHPDYRPGWNRVIDDPRDRGATYEDYKKRTTIWAQRETELDAFYDRFELVETERGEYWRCKTCGACGEEQRPILSVDIAAAISDGPRKHPTCPERTST